MCGVLCRDAVLEGAKKWLEEQGVEAVDREFEVYPLAPMPEPEIEAEVGARASS